MFPFAIEAILGLIKVLGTVYDVVTLPVYAVLQQPWVYWKRKRMCFAKPLIEGDPSSPYRLLDNSELESLKGVQTLDEVARRAIRSYAKRPAMGTRRVLGRSDEKQPNGKVFKKLVLGDYEWLTYEEVDRKVDLTARGLLSIGARPRQFVAILAETRAEWMLTAQACFRTNIPLVTMYATLSNDDIVSAVNVTEVTHLVTSADLLTRVVSVVAKMPSLTHIVYMESPNAKPPAPLAKGPQVIPFSSLEERGADHELEECSPSPDDVAIVMFTSGSSGMPKGVMASHRNLISAMNGFGVVCDQFGAYTSDDVYIAYLPLAHMLELAAETLLFGAGARIGYSSPLTITDNSSAVAKGCRGDVTLLQPTVFVCVPLIVDRLRKGVNEIAASKGPLFKALFDYAVQYKNFWLDVGFDTPFLNQLVFKHVRLLMGPNLKVLACGSAPLSGYTRRFVRACMGCRVIEGYGLTETSGAATIMNADDASADRVGAPLPGCYIKLVDWDEGNYRLSDKPNPRGEIVVGGPCVAKGYFKNDELTKESFREEGGIRWFYTGDIGEIFPDGTLKIVDRKKDLIKLQFGEYISLGRVESVLKTCPLVDNLFVYGNSLHTYLVALVAPNHKHLQRIARDLGRGYDVSNASLKELCQDTEVAKAAEEEILAYARSSDLLKTEVPGRVKLCAEEWKPDSGLVTATYKIRRKPLQSFYQRDIDAMYGSSEESRLRRA
ncbi:long-chain-fatty-acid--CoA ligase 4 [Dermacentor silvarum]|uniref:long-chain-fatty-acid--CoA ligase 4 n=1 Tax=Dermacentor silvarum TaxID=543639 RepID=UPI00189A3478|nr:long-chain-fatty-acid--CoA ligase 4 [Dermacentor silvarum]XP_049526089.1 long-chain-fatty-acid--CoA ligase 4 [Dermacentor silvarum]